MKLGLVSRQNLSDIALRVDGGREVSYSELHSEINRFSRLIPTGSLVFLIGSNDLESITFYLACLEKAAVPLLLPKEIANEALENLISVYKPNYLFKPINNGTNEFTLIYEEGKYALFQNVIYTDHNLHPDLALLMATSGSTGSPKLVKLTLRNLIENATSITQYLNISTSEIAITSLPFNYSFGLSIINSHLLAGASIVLTDRSLLDSGFWKLINDHKVTSLSGVPYTYEMLLKLRLERLKMPSVKTLTQAGGRLDSLKVRKVAEYCLVNNLNFFTMYGQTEATARISYLPINEILARPSSIGKPIPNGKLWVRRTNGQKVENPNEVGELIYEGPNVCMGYAETMADLQLGDELNGVLCTGDLARFDQEGYFYIEGRIKRFLKIFGIRVSLDAVEKILIDDGVEAVVHGVDDLLVIFVIGLKVEDCDVIKKKVALTLGLHHSGVAVRVLEKIPRLINGKVDYQCLSQSI